MVTALTSEQDYEWVFEKKHQEPSASWPKWKIRNLDDQADVDCAKRHTTIEKYDRHFEFEIFLDQRYPFAQPQVFAVTRFTRVVDLYDGKDLYTEVLNGEEWKVARNLHEIIANLPDFIEAIK